LYVSEQSDPHDMPAGALVTVPAPVPDLDTVSRYWAGGAILNKAVTSAAVLIVTVQVPVPEHPPPDHPAKTEPPPAVAVSSTGVPPAYSSEQSEPQVMPVGELVTVPEPVPDLSTVSS